MFKYAMIRLLSLIPMMLGITFISFMVVQLTPGEPVLLGQTLDPQVDANAAQRIKDLYGLNQPVHIQYIQWLERLISFDFGISFSPDNRPVADKILEKLPITLWMNIIGLLLVLMIAIPLGMYSARYQNSFFDNAATVVVLTLFAAPAFWIAMLAMILFGVVLGWLPISGISTFGSAHWPWYMQLLDYARHLLLPISIGVMGSIAGMSRYMRSSMIDVITQEYITTARAKGASETRILYKHALPNALIPVITILGLSIPGLIGGSVIFESLFAIPGMGKLFFDGVMMRDYPLIMGILTIGAFLTLIGNLIADLAYAWVDPRIRKELS